MGLIIKIKIELIDNTTQQTYSIRDNYNAGYKTYTFYLDDNDYPLGNNMSVRIKILDAIAQSLPLETIEDTRNISIIEPYSVTITNPEAGDVLVKQDPIRVDWTTNTTSGYYNFYLIDNQQVARKFNDNPVYFGWETFHYLHPDDLDGYTVQLGPAYHIRIENVDQSGQHVCQGETGNVTFTNATVPEPGLHFTNTIESPVTAGANGLYSVPIKWTTTGSIGPLRFILEVYRYDWSVTYAKGNLPGGNYTSVYGTNNLYWVFSKMDLDDFINNPSYRTSNFDPDADFYYSISVEESDSPGATLDRIPLNFQLFQIEADLTILE